MAGSLDSMDTRETLLPETLIVNDAPEVTAATAPAPDASSEGQKSTADASSEEQKPAADASEEQKPAADASSEDQKPPALSPESAKVAIVNYASSINKDPKEVTMSMVEASKEGPLFWATMKSDMSARGPTAQSMGRALKHKPDVKTLYGLLLDSFKLEFRRAWACSKDFQFATTTRSTVNTFRKRRDELGTYKTFLQIVQLLGGTDEPIAVEQAKNYTKMCCRDDLKDKKDNSMP